MMTSAQVVETSVNVTSNSPSQDYTHPDDHNLPNYNINIIDLFSLNLILFDALFKFIVTFIDKEYRELYEKTERARLEWEAAMYKFCQVKSVELVYPVLVHFNI